MLQCDVRSCAAVMLNCRFIMS